MDNNVYNNEIVNKLEELGIDVKLGMKYCGDMEFYIEVLGISLELYEERCSNLNKYFNDKDYHNYTILVHSIKSGLANIGAIEISKMARALEDAGKDADYKYVIDNHENFIRGYSCLMEGLHSIVNSDKNIEASSQQRVQEEKIDDWGIILDGIEHNLQELELDVVLELVDEILLCDIRPIERELMTAIKNNLHHFDVEGAKISLETLKTECSIL